jgi:hypothetical protein
MRVLVFEPGLELRELRPRKGAFEDCGMSSPLLTVTFETGSKLRCIETLAFSHCSSLTSICLPASVEEIEGGAFSSSDIREITIEKGNRNFVVVDHFLMEFEKISVIQYFGRESCPKVPSGVEILRASSFFNVGCIRSVDFSLCEKISSIEAHAFCDCGSLLMIHIPSSVSFIGENCFNRCH